MEIKLQTISAFRGWEAFADALAALEPRAALGVIQIIVSTLAARSNGVFDGTGSAPLSPTNVHVIVRELICLLPDETLPVLDVAAECRMLPVLIDLAWEINGLRETHPIVAAIQAADVDAWSLLWFHYLEQQGLGWSPRLELGRGWRMFAEIWPALVASGKITIPSYAESAFLNPAHMLLLGVALHRARGHIVDVREAMHATQLSEGQLSAILEVFACWLPQAKAELGAMPKYPSTLQNFFRRHTTIRSSEWGVFAPLPDLLYQCWDLQRMFEGLECTLVNVPHKPAQRYYGSLGIVFEQYVREVLGEMATLSAGQALEPFPISNELESPDGFLVFGQDVLVFEAKGHRIPGKAYEHLSINDFLSWFGKALGVNDAGRKPLAQGNAFYERWNQQDQDVAQRLGTAIKKSIYVVVTYEDPPVFCDFRAFCQWYARNHLDTRFKDLWDRTVVISIRALEALAGACRLPQGQAEGKAFPLKLLREYMAYRDSAPDIGPNDRQVKAPFGNWLLETRPWIRRGEPQLVYAARRRLFEAAQAAGFGDGNLNLGADGVST